MPTRSKWRGAREERRREVNKVLDIALKLAAITFHRLPLALTSEGKKKSGKIHTPGTLQELQVKSRLRKIWKSIRK